MEVEARVGGRHFRGLRWPEEKGREERGQDDGSGG